MVIYSFKIKLRVYVYVCMYPYEVTNLPGPLRCFLKLVCAYVYVVCMYTCTIFFRCLVKVQIGKGYAYIHSHPFYWN